jgi:hypothetical protein
MTQDFPPPPPLSLSREDIIALLTDIRSRGWPVYQKNADTFLIEDNEMDTTTVSISADGTCHVNWHSARGLSASGSSATNLIQLEELLKRFRESEPTKTRLKRGEPASNLQRIVRLIGRSKVEAMYDPYFDDKGLDRLLSLVRVSGAAASNLRVLTAGKSSVGLSKQLLADVLRELGCPQGAIRKVANPRTAHRRFLLLSGGKSLILGMSLNDIDKDEAAHLEADAEDRPFFDDEWGKATPI